MLSQLFTTAWLSSAKYKEAHFLLRVQLAKGIQIFIENVVADDDIMHIHVLHSISHDMNVVSVSPNWKGTMFSE